MVEYKLKDKNELSIVEIKEAKGEINIYWNYSILKNKKNKLKYMDMIFSFFSRHMIELKLDKKTYAEFNKIFSEYEKLKKKEDKSTKDEEVDEDELTKDE